MPLEDRVPGTSGIAGPRCRVATAGLEDRAAVLAELLLQLLEQLVAGLAPEALAEARPLPEVVRHARPGDVRLFSALVLPDALVLLYSSSRGLALAHPRSCGSWGHAVSVCPGFEVRATMT